MARAFTLPPATNPMSIGRLIEVHAGRDPDYPALTCGEVTLTRGELAARITRRARALIRAGVEQDDFVAIALPNGTAFMEIAFACWAIGATPAPVSRSVRAGELRVMCSAAMTDRMRSPLGPVPWAPAWTASAPVRALATRMFVAPPA